MVDNTNGKAQYSSGHLGMFRVASPGLCGKFSESFLLPRIRAMASLSGVTDSVSWSTMIVGNQPFSSMLKGRLSWLSDMGHDILSDEVRVIARLSPQQQSTHLRPQGSGQRCSSKKTHLKGTLLSNAMWESTSYLGAWVRMRLSSWPQKNKGHLFICVSYDISVPEIRGSHGLQKRVPSS